MSVSELTRTIDNLLRSIINGDRVVRITTIDNQTTVSIVQRGRSV